MYKSYFKIGWRNLLKNKGYSFINITGLATGMTVAMLIGLWMYDELSFDKHQSNHNEVALVLQNVTVGGKVETHFNQSYQLGDELRNNFGNHFKKVSMAYFSSSIFSFREKTFTIEGGFMETHGPEILELKMRYGTRTALEDPSSTLLSASTAEKFFGNENPVGKILKLDNNTDLKVMGVYEDLPDQSSFNDLHFISSLEILVNRGGRNLGWVNNWLLVLVEVADRVDIHQAAVAIKDVKLRNVSEYEKRFNPELFLHPMNKWHLNSDFNNGVNIGGRIQFVWLFGAIGLFVMLLASINFMNLSTARSQIRAKEVGVRKAIGSKRSQLISQFFTESLVVVGLAFVLSVMLVQLVLPAFNEVTNKDISILWISPSLWMLLIVFVFLTAMISGSYPAFYLSAFNPIKTLKGTFRLGQYASVPRKFLVVVQFTVSVSLIIGTIIVYQQIDFVKKRPIGYDLNGLITIPIKTQEVKDNYNSFRNELLDSGVITEVSTSETTITNLWWSDNGFEWKGKDPDLQDIIYRGAVNYEFGKTVGWKIVEGRDFSRDFPSDSSAVILNETAVAYMGFANPVGETIQAYGRDYTVIGVVEDMVMQSIYQPNQQTVFILDRFNRQNFINVRANPQSNATDVIAELNRVFVKYNPETPFEYAFAEDEFAQKFDFEERIGKLVGIFSILAVIISCLGLFGLASFVAEQRTKEIGIRKVLGASIVQLWKMLSIEFIILVIISCVIAIPLSFYIMNNWLVDYEYRTTITWEVFVMAVIGAMLLTMFTVSYQAIRAARANPVTSLKAE